MGVKRLDSDRKIVDPVKVITFLSDAELSKIWNVDIINSEKMKGGRNMGLIMDLLKKDNETKMEERIPARCGITKESYDIHLGYENGKLTMLRGTHIYTDDTSMGTRSGAKAGYKKINLSNGLHVGRTYHCPVCGNKDIVRCGKCRRITCYDGNGYFTCAYCGNSGKVSGTMDSIEAYDNSGMKQNGMKYYSGDKGDKLV